ncbi:hypothetical protein C1Y63_08420 [Corynebacterium sp. 13CS0277]|uniref:hypothetical protein n=1 Tax=Corynebacterium sp. 13CS0277 TaxID=2071994 RepID=UPI000D0482DA|nr:hypothetical protein [Corynebacterium sp. 13CS0277]PRQ11011.1 hypothetical protein C1Y63_08420 [Corynebacterium sp. 13CS0277]
MSVKPTFTDINGIKVVCTLADQNDFEYLEIDKLLDDGTKERLLTLNMYDAKKLFGACEMFMARTIAKNFSNMNGQLTPNDRNSMLDDE